jgi:hypothetical protein
MVFVEERFDDLIISGDEMDHEVFGRETGQRAIATAHERADGKNSAIEYRVLGQR